MSMNMASRMTTTRVRDTEGMMDEARMADMDTGTTHTGSSITTTATITNDIKTKKTCGDTAGVRESIDNVGTAARRQGSDESRAPVSVPLSFGIGQRARGGHGRRLLLSK